MTPARRNLFALAERLGFLVCDMQHMPLREFYEWLEFYTVRKEIDDDSVEATDDAGLLAAFGMKS